MTFTVTYRGADGALREEAVEAAGRAECFTQMKARGIVPVSVKEGASLGERASRPFRSRAKTSPRNAQDARCPSGGGKPRSSILNPKSAIFLAVLLAAAGGAWWWFGASKTPHPGKPKTVNAVKGVASLDDLDGTKGVQAPEAATRRSTAAKSGETAPAPSGQSSGGPEMPALPAAPTNTPSIPPLPPQTFSNASDQVLAMIASADASGDMPPLPISRDIEAEFLKSLKQEIVILDTDDDKTRELKLAVKETREQLKQLIASGKTVAEVLAEHQQLASENARVRNDAMLELRQLIESGDIEGAKEYKRKINIALQQMGIAEMTIPVTDEERAERAVARRERMLKKRAAQAAEAEKLNKENKK